MHKDAKRTLFWRLMSAGALLIGAAALPAVDSLQAQDNPSGGRVFRNSRYGYASRPAQPRKGRSSIQQVQNQEPAFEDAADKDRPFEEPGQTPAAPPAFEQADDKEKPPEEPGPEPWQLTNLFTDECGQNPLKDRGWKLAGHSAWGYSSDPDGSFTGNGPYVNQQEWGQFNATQQYLYLEKVADGKKGFDWGLRGDVMYGVDGNEGQAFGNINPGRWDYLNGYDHGAYEWAFPQLYGEVAMGDLSIKGGHFYTIVGYEVVPSTGNFFFSRQINFWNSEPFTHTGVLATYKVNDKFTVLGGWTLGWDTGFYQFNGGSAFLGGFSYKLDDKTDLVYAMSGGNFGWRGDGAVNSTILSRKWTEKFTTVHQFDVLETNLAVDGTPVSLADNNGLNSRIARNSIGFINYAFYDLTPKVKAGLRAEWYKADGTSYYEITGGFNVRPWDWLLIRPEVRGMWSPGNQLVYEGADGYNDQLFNQTVFGIDAIIVF